MKKISGIVKRGKGKGHILGFPTANLDLGLEIEKGNKIESGVYEGCAYIYGAKCKAGIFVLRELVIPYVIGTKVATEKLSNGDLVKVDANNGTVKIILSH